MTNQLKLCAYTNGTFKYVVLKELSLKRCWILGIIIKCIATLIEILGFADVEKRKKKGRINN